MFRAVVLGAVQGLTEFIPVSSSAHLVLVPYLLGWRIPGLAFDVAVHVGTTIALIIYFRRELVGMAAGVVRTMARRGDEHDRSMGRLALLLLVASIPAALAGLLLEKYFEQQFGEPAQVALQLLVTAGLLVGGDAVYRRRAREARDLTAVGWSDALLMGAFQAISIAPGISRSGATIAAGLVRGLSRDAAARFSFLLGLPALAGAALVKIPDLPHGAALGPVVVATIVSGVLGFASIAFLLRYVRSRNMTPFAVYCALFAAVALGFWFQVK